MKNTSVLIVDDDRITRETLSKALSENYTTLTARNGQEALDILNKDNIDVVLSDLIMPGLNGLNLLEKIDSLDNKPIVIFITGHATVESAVQAMKMGAYDYITKPINLDRLLILIEKALENKRLKEENIFLRHKIKENYNQLNLIGSSSEIKKVIDLVHQVSSTTATVLIEGESGTGKELIANIIHYNSPVADGPLIKVNCATFAEGVLESELFGHEKGAFTGAISTKKGRFELADSGTLFLDDAGDIPPSIQVKLLRFLQEKSFERVGGTKTLHVNVRLISATNKRLEEMIKDGTFREDLYYRLRIVKIEVPPLRKRKEDIEQLVRYSLDKYSNIHNKPIKGISDNAMQLIKEYNWPGNIRELMNCIESAVVMTHEEIISTESLPSYLFKSTETDSSMRTGRLPDVERKVIIETLLATGGNKVRAAKILGIGLRTLYRKVKEYGIIP